MAVSRSYPRHFFRFCEKKRKKAFSLLFSFFFKDTIFLFNRYNLTQHGLAWLNLAQHGSVSLAQLSLAQLGLA